MNNSEGVHVADSLKNLTADHFTFVLTQLKCSVSDGVEEVTPSKILSDDATLIDALIVFMDIYNKWTL